MVASVPFGQEMNAQFMNDLENSQQIDSSVWQERSVIERLEEAITGCMGPML